MWSINHGHSRSHDELGLVCNARGCDSSTSSLNVFAKGRHNPKKGRWVVRANESNRFFRDCQGADSGSGREGIWGKPGYQHWSGSASGGLAPEGCPVSSFRSALLSLPLPALIGLHAGRLGGVIFLLFHADGRLSALFAPASGVGDMATGMFAVVLVGLLALGVNILARLGSSRGMCGAVDLVVAVSRGTLSMPGTPFRIFTEEPGPTARCRLL